MSENKEFLEEAIKHFKSLQKRYTREHNGKMCEKVAVALEALEKQIPKKPYWRVVEGDVIEEDIEGYACPVCDIGVTCDHGRIKLGHCPSCGQMLDWSDEE